MLKLTLLLGVVQGITEFLPVSSSGHLALLQYFMHFQKPPLPYTIVLHIATLLSVLLFFNKKLIYLILGLIKFEREYLKLSLNILICIIPTAIIGLLLEDKVSALMLNPFFVSLFLFITGIILLSVSFYAKRQKLLLGDSDPAYSSITWYKSLIIGVLQGLAVFPGISRSGITISTGIFLKLSPEDAFDFSFLIFIPVVIGSLLLELLKLNEGFFNALPVGWVFGFLTAFISGLISLFVLRKFVLKLKFHIFGLYCILLSFFVVFVMSVF